MSIDLLLPEHSIPVRQPIISPIITDTDTIMAMVSVGTERVFLVSRMHIPLRSVALYVFVPTFDAASRRGRTLSPAAADHANLQSNVIGRENRSKQLTASATLALLRRADVSSRSKVPVTVHRYHSNLPVCFSVTIGLAG